MHIFTLDLDINSRCEAFAFPLALHNKKHVPTKIVDSDFDFLLFVLLLDVKNKIFDSKLKTAEKFS